jgi:hypothetical protein
MTPCKVAQPIELDLPDDKYNRGDPRKQREIGRVSARKPWAKTAA